MSPTAHRYFAACHKGLEEITAAELRGPEIGASAVKSASSGVHFEGDQAVGYRANLWLRSAIRVHQELGRGPAPDTDALYEWAKSIDWPSLMRLDQTFAVDARVWDSAITHSKYAALRVKDALCDRFRAETGRRPNVYVPEPDLPLYLYVHRNEATLYRDTSGLTLHKRGYRDVMHRTSLNEALAAALVLRAGYDGSAVLADPMCGAGTFAIEAAMIALGRAPGLLRAHFAFERWPDFDPAAWRQAKSSATRAARTELAVPIFANDWHAGALSLARKDAESACVARFIRFSNDEVAAFEPSAQPRTVLVNPPWSDRLDGPEVRDAWRNLGQFLQRRCSGGKAWVLTGNLELAAELGLKPAQRLSLRNGKVECTLLRFDLP